MRGPAAIPLHNDRDPRVDLLRGLSLLMIFFDHIPYNCLSNVTLQSVGFSDAAEIFVFLAGYAGVMAYGPVLEARGFGAVLRKSLRRCLRLWGMQAGLVIATVTVLALRRTLSGASSPLLAPMLADGLSGVLRGLTLQAQPAYLDVLPLYIVLLLLLPLVLLGLRISIVGTFALSLGIHLAATLTHANLPNQIDPRAAATWSFNPFTWQLVYVIGAIFAVSRSRGLSGPATRPPLLRAGCLAYLGFGFLVSSPFTPVPSLAEMVWIKSALGSEPKCFATPWRVLHAVVLLYLLLTSSSFAALARHAVLEPLAACGRRSLPVFAAGCILALFGRIAFGDFGPGLATQVCVNVAGVTAMLVLAAALESRRSPRSVRSGLQLAGIGQET